MLELSKTYKPFKYGWAMELAEKHELMFWTTKEIKLQDDIRQWKAGEITAIEKAHITQILRLFTQSDVVVGNSYCDVFVLKFKNNELRHLLLTIANRECTHARAYALLNDTLGFPDKEYSAFLEYAAMKEKIEFMQNYDTSTLSGLGKALAQTVCNEGLSLFSAFAMLLNYQRFGKMKGMCEVVEWSSKDETLHVEAMTRLFRQYCEEHPKIVNDVFKSSIYQMFTDAVNLEDQVIELAYQAGETEGLRKEEVKDYIRYLADRRLMGLGLKPIYKIESNPISWLDWVLSGDTFANFFESVPTNYIIEGMSGDDWGW